MTCAYEYSWDVSKLTTALTFEWSNVTDGTASVTISTGEYSHTDISAYTNYLGDVPDRLSSIQAFASHLQTQVNAASGETWTITYDESTFSYSIGITTFTTITSAVGSDAQLQMHRILGIPSTGSSLAVGHISTLRPYYLLVPSIEARSDVSDEYFPDGIASDAMSDGGIYYQTSVDDSAVFLDWTQNAEPDSAPAAHTTAGTPVFIRSATSEVPWTYQHAWRHCIDQFCVFKVNDDVSTSDGDVYEMRAEGLSFKPRRMAGKDYSLWNIPYNCRLLGRGS